MAEKVENTFRRKFIAPSGILTGDAQTAYALAIEFNLSHGEGEIARWGQRLAFLVSEGGNRIATGFAETSLITDALTHLGMSISHTTFCLSASARHGCALCSPEERQSGNGGIACSLTARIAFRPQPGGGLTYARAAHETPYVRTLIEGHLGDGKLSVEVVFPIGTRGVVQLSGSEKIEVGP